MRGRRSKKQECATSFFLFCRSSYPPCYLSYKTQLRPPSWHCRPVLDIMANVPALSYNLGPEGTVNCDAKATFQHGDRKSPMTLSKPGPGTTGRSARGSLHSLPGVSAGIPGGSEPLRVQAAVQWPTRGLSLSPPSPQCLFLRSHSPKTTPGVSSVQSPCHWASSGLIT